MNRIPTVTKNLLIINVLLWFGSLALTKLGIDLNSLLGLHFFKASNFRLYQLFTYMFMHEGFQHVFFNMFAVWMFGGVMEQTWGARRFLFFYIACGLGAGLIQEGAQYLQWFFELSQYEQFNQGSRYLNMMNTVGASGAVYGILLGYGMTYPNNQLFIIPIPVPIKAKWLVTAYVVLELLLGLSNRPGDNVAHFAHLGGMLVGFLIILYWRNKYRMSR